MTHCDWPKAMAVAEEYDRTRNERVLLLGSIWYYSELVIDEGRYKR